MWKSPPDGPSPQIISGQNFDQVKVKHSEKQKSKHILLHTVSRLNLASGIAT